MKYEDKYKDAKDGDEVEPSILKCKIPGKCGHCTTETTFVDIDFNCYICSEECEQKETDFFFNACNKNKRPIIVCLCGSTRFMDVFFEQGWNETLAGKIVLSVGVCKHADKDGAHGAETLGPEVVKMLDELHKRKIDLADEVFILNVGGYIGDSTRSEIEYAKKHNKYIRYLEEIK